MGLNNLVDSKSQPEVDEIIVFSITDNCWKCDPGRVVRIVGMGEGEFALNCCVNRRCVNSIISLCEKQKTAVWTGIGCDHVDLEEVHRIVERAVLTGVLEGEQEVYTYGT